LDAAASLDARSIAVPAISAGIYGYPRAEATAVIAAEALRWLAANPTPIESISLVAYDSATAGDFEAGLAAAG
jgi:O-acetyl-ADP-ribose deacetylase (regulator of RNase III)